jgi:hypothetical protein
VDLRRSGLAYSQEDYGSGFASTQTDAFRAMNPNAMVPVLIDGDFILWESNSICRYLARKAGRDDLLPGEPRACANVEHWMDWQATDFNSAWRYVFRHWCVKTRTTTIRMRLPPVSGSGITASVFSTNSCNARARGLPGDIHPCRYRAGIVGEPLEDDAV